MTDNNRTKEEKVAMLMKLVPGLQERDARTWFPLYQPYSYTPYTSRGTQEWLVNTVIDIEAGLPWTPLWKALNEEEL